MDDAMPSREEFENMRSFFSYLSLCGFVCVFIYVFFVADDYLLFPALVGGFGLAFTSAILHIERF